MTRLYYITNWPYHECKDAAKAKKMHWVKAKVDFNGDDWLAIVQHKDSAAALATWEVLRGVAQVSPWRGLILTDGIRPKPHTVESLFAKTRLKKHLIRKGLSVLINLVGWVSECKVTQNYDELSQRLWGASYGIKGFTPENSGQTADKQPTNSGETADVCPPLTENSTGENNTEDERTPNGGSLSAEKLAERFFRHRQPAQTLDTCTRHINATMLGGVAAEAMAATIEESALGCDVWVMTDAAKEYESKREEREALVRVEAAMAKEREGKK